MSCRFRHLISLLPGGLFAGLLIFVGACILKFSPFARERGFVWQLGASLHRLLPGVHLDKQFEDLFDKALDDTVPRKLTRSQLSIFCVIALFGWVFAALLAAIVAGLTPK